MTAPESKPSGPLARATAGLGWVLHHTDRAGEALIVLLFAVIVLVGGLQVLCRYGFNASLGWSEELQRYGLIWMVFVALPELAPVEFPRKMFAAVDSFSLLALPYFILAGELMVRGGMSRRLVEFAETLVGHLDSEHVPEMRARLPVGGGRSV